MIVFSTLIQAVVTILSSLLTVYSFIVIGRCIISWVSPDPYNPIVRFLYTVTEPLMWRIRKYLPFTYFSGIDLSPIILLIGVYLAKQLVWSIGAQILSSIHL